LKKSIISTSLATSLLLGSVNTFAADQNYRVFVDGQRCRSTHSRIS
jgi:hypothetical protein